MVRKKDTRFKPGKSGNPKGRPPAELCLTTLLRAALSEHDEDGKRTKARSVIDALVLQACEGKTAAIEQIFNRIDGILQTQETRPELDLETIAKEMQAKRDKLRGGESAGGTAGGVPG